MRTRTIGVVPAAGVGARLSRYRAPKELIQVGYQDAGGQPLPKAAIERIFAPMGLEIGAVTPEEIAVSVAAEMIACRRLPTGDWKALSKSIYARKKLTTA